jgi:hypothetical protein
LFYETTSTYRQKPIDETRFLLTVAPNASHSLVVVSRIPVGIEHHEAIGTNQVKTTSTSFTAEKKDEI